MAMVILVPSLPATSSTRCLASAAGLPGLQWSSSTFRHCNLGGAGRSRRDWRFQISAISGTTRATRDRSRRNFSARSSGSSGDLLTKNGKKDGTAEDETCEIVQGSNITLGEGEYTFQAYLVQALKNNNGVAVLCLTDDYGFENEENRGFAYRLACFGYNVLVPDLFQGEPWSEGRPKSEYYKWLEPFSPDRVAGIIDVATKYLADEIDTVGKLVVIGFGFGGGLMIETLARDSNGAYATGAFLYGFGFEISLAAEIKVPLLLIGGGADLLSPADIYRQIEREVPGSKTKIYPGVGHGFAHRPTKSEEDEASEAAFTEIRHWLHNRLLPNSRK